MTDPYAVCLALKAIAEALTLDTAIQGIDSVGQSSVNLTDASIVNVPYVEVFPINGAITRKAAGANESYNTGQYVINQIIADTGDYASDLQLASAFLVKLVEAFDDASFDHTLDGLTCFARLSSWQYIPNGQEKGQKIRYYSVFVDVGIPGI